MNKIRLGWTGFDQLVNDIARAIYKSGVEIYKVYGIPRGGLVPAVALSHRLGVPLTDSLGPYTLLVDDISDSGKTFKEITKNGELTRDFPHFYTASLYQRRGSDFIPHFTGLIIDDPRWIVFPWEVKTGDFAQFVEI